MSSRYILGINFGTSSLRIHRSSLRDDGELEVPPQMAAITGLDRDALPMVIELDPTTNEVVIYGKPALDNLLSSSGGGRTFVLEFKPCLGQAKEDLAQQGRPTVALVRVCKECGRACSPDAAFCAKCGKPLPPVEEASSEVLFRYSQDEAFGWSQRLLEKVAHDLTGRIYAQAITESNGWKVVTGIPVHWHESTKARFREILVKCSGNENVELLAEPEAALRYHLWSKTIPPLQPDKSVLVVDFGAGTTDFTLSRLGEDGKTLIERKTYGERYGGGDFDVALATYIAEKLNIPLDADLPLALKQQGRHLKEQFSQALAQGQTQCAAPIFVRLEGKDYAGVVSLDEATFVGDELAGKLVREFEVMLGRALGHFGIASGAVGVVIITGGGAAWYFVEATVKRVFPRCPVLVGSEPDKAISKGLALPPSFAAELAQAIAAEPPSPVVEPRIEVREAEPEPVQSSEPRAGEERVNSKDDAAMVYIPAGEFLMGSNEMDVEKPIHHVRVEGFCYWGRAIGVVLLGSHLKY